MGTGPEWLPGLDVDTAASFVESGLQQVPTDLLTTAEPTTLVLGTVVGTLAQEGISEYSRKLDLRLQQYVDEHDDEKEAITARVAAGVSRLLPDGEELNQAALQAARGDPEELRAHLQAYYQDDQRRAELDEAVQRILTGDFDDVEESLTETFGTSDIGAAQALLMDFLELVRTRQTQQTLEGVLDLDEQFDRLAEDLDRMQEELEYNITRGLTEDALRDEGFRRLSPFLLDRDIEDPAQPWRAGFDFVHVREGFAVDRRRPDGTNVTDEVFDALRSAQSGTSRIVLGPAGSGKSTICKAVACRWYDHPGTGPVFYRESGRGETFGGRGKLERLIRGSSGHVLVVVEDAVRSSTDAIYDVIDEFRGTDVAVSFLLDARRGELDGFEDATGMETGAADQLRQVASNIQRYDVPALDPDDPAEVHRLIERFEEKTDSEVTHTAEYIHDQVVGSEARLGELLYLAYFLPVGGDEAAGLEGDVRAKHRTILDPTNERSQREEFAQFDEDLRRDVALLVNLLNASGVGVHPELVHALGHVHGNDRETHREIQEIRDALGGWMLYPQIDEESSVQQTTHELWSTLYLRSVSVRYEEVGDEGFDRGGRERFQACVDALFRLCDDDGEQRRAIEGGFDDPELLDTLDDDPDEMADVLVRDIFELAGRWPILVRLYGTHEESTVTLPDTCGTETERRLRTKQGHMHHKAGNYDAARTAYQSASELSEELDDRAGIANSLNNLGSVARQQGAYEDAREYHQQSLEIKEELGDRQGIATSLGNLGNVALQQGAYDDAREYYEQSLDICEELGDRQGIATSLGNLGAVAQQQGAYDDAREHYERAAQAYLDIGAVRRALTALENLVSACDELGRRDEAIEWCDTALDLIERSNIPGIEGEGGTFEARRVLLSDGDPEEQIVKLHLHGCGHVLQQDGKTALELFEGAWELRAEVPPDEQAYLMGIASGLAVAIHVRIFEDYDAGGEYDAILDAARNHRDDLTPGPRALRAVLENDDPEHSPEELRELADSDDISEITSLEARACALLVGLADEHPRN